MKIKLRRLQLLFSILIFSKISVAQCPPSFSIKNYTVNAPQWGITAADFNSDGNMDLATANMSNSCVSVYYGSANGTFTTITNYTTNLLAPIQIKSADFNSDGKADLAVTNDNPHSSQLSILLNSGTGTFGPATNYSIAANTFGLATEDFDSDGKKDLVTASYSGVQFLKSLGNGSFSPPVIVASASPLRHILAADFNNDSKADLAVASSGNYVALLLGTGTGAFNLSYTLPLQTMVNINVLAGGDLNNDGNQDLILDMVSSNPSIGIFLGSGFGNLTAGPGTYGIINGAAAGDFNLDGKTDFVTTDAAGFAQINLHGNNTNFSLSTYYQLFTYMRDVVVADFNLDSKPDFATTDGGIGGVYASVFLNTQSAPNFTVGITSSSSVICAGETVTLTATGAQNYNWDTIYVPSVIVSPSITTTYSVTGYSNLCQAKTSFLQIVNSCTGLTKTNSTAHINIFPNPATHEINIKTEGGAIVFISLTNSLGEIVRTSNIQKSQEVKLDLNSLKAGLYVVTIKTQENSFMQQKLVIESR